MIIYANLGIFLYAEHVDTIFSPVTTSSQFKREISNETQKKG